MEISKYGLQENAFTETTSNNVSTETQNPDNFNVTENLIQSELALISKVESIKVTVLYIQKWLIFETANFIITEMSINIFCDDSFFSLRFYRKTFSKKGNALR